MSTHSSPRPHPTTIPLPPSHPSSPLLPRHHISSDDLPPIPSSSVPPPKPRRSSTLNRLTELQLGREEKVDEEARREEEGMGDPFKKAHTIRFNQPVGSMSISPSNRDIALASRKGLYILDVANLHQAPRFIPQGGKWNPADCQWSPHPSHSHLILTTSSQKLLVWDLLHSPSTSSSPPPSSNPYNPSHPHQHHHQQPDSALHLSISAHFRAITDINWHARDPHLVATTGIDGGVSCFDLRTRLGYGGAGRNGYAEGTEAVEGKGDGVIRLAAWGAAGTQVKWNRQHDRILASSHGGEVRIWDIRKGSLPITVIQAHTSRIYGIDWDRRTRHQIVTCSLDKTIKRFTITSLSPASLPTPSTSTQPFFPSLPAPSAPDLTITTSHPVWRARNLPFGRGVLSLPGRGGGAGAGGMEMWGLVDGSGRPLEGADGGEGGRGRLVMRWRGHEEGVKEFVWRARGGQDAGFDDREFQLISWGQDRLLKIRPVDLDVLERVGHKRGAPIDLLVSRRGAQDISYARLPAHYPEPPTIDVQTPGVDPLQPTNRPNIPPPMSRGGTTMTRGTTNRRRMRGEDPLHWMINVREEHGKDYSTSSSREESGRSSRLQSVSRGGSSREPSRERSLGGSSRGGGRRGSGEERAGIDLQDEIRRVTQTFPKVKFENASVLEVVKRRYTVSLHGPWAEGSRLAFIRAEFSFPPQYPYSLSKEHIPTLELQTPASVSEATRIVMLQRLQNIRETHRPCLSACIAYLLGYQERRGRATFGASDSDSDEDRVLVQAPIKDPRTCGASFGPNGELVCFFKSGMIPMKRRVASDSRSPSTAPAKIPPEALKPRQHASLTHAISALSRMADQATGDGRSRLQKAALLFPENFNLARANARSRSQHRRQDRNRLGVFQRPSSIVVVRDCAELVPLDREAGERYFMFSEPDACAKNERIAKDLKNEAHAEIWKMVGILLNAKTLGRYEKSEEASGPPPPMFKRKRKGTGAQFPAQSVQTTPIVVQALFDGLAEAKDVQMLSLLSRFFDDHEKSFVEEREKSQIVKKTVAKPDYFASRSTSRAISLRDEANTPRAESPSSPIPFGFSFSSYRQSSWSLATSNKSTGGFFGQRDRQDSDTSLYRPGGEDIATPSIAMPPGLRQQSYRSASPRERDRPVSQIATTPSGSLSPTFFVNAPPRSNLNEVTGMSSSLGSSKHHRVSFGPDSFSPQTKTKDPPSMGRSIRGRRKGYVQPWDIKMELTGFTAARIAPLDTSKRTLYECWRNVYGDILSAWQLFPQRAEVLQRSFLEDPEDAVPARGRMASSLFQAHSKCQSCGKLTIGQEFECSSCRSIRQRQPCSICRLPIAALCITCSVCHHVTHSTCVESLLDRPGETEYSCGSGCGCACLENGFAGLAPALAPVVSTSPVQSLGGLSDRRTLPRMNSDSASIMTAVLAREIQRQAAAEPKSMEDSSNARTGLLARAGIRNLAGDRFSNFLGAM